MLVASFFLLLALHERVGLIEVVDGLEIFAFLEVEAADIVLAHVHCFVVVKLFEYFHSILIVQHRDSPRILSRP